MTTDGISVPVANYAGVGSKTPPIRVSAMPTEIQRRKTMARKKVDYDWKLYEFSLEELGISLDPSFESAKTPVESKSDAGVGVGIKTESRRRS